MEIKFHIGRKCNLRCSYCHVEKDDFDNDNHLNVLDKVIESVGDRKKISRLLITGGEPTLYHDQVISILEKYKDLNRINIPSNGTDPDKIIEYGLRYKNVIPSISWDGHTNGRGFDSFDSVKLIQQAGIKCNILYVISNDNYFNLYDDFMELSQIIPDIESRVELIFVMMKESDYKMDFNIMRDQLTKLYRAFPQINIFRRNKNRKCPAIYSDDYLVEIRDGKIYKGCINYSFNKSQATHKLKNCMSEAENKCLTCDIDVCRVCGSTIVSKFTNSDIENMYDGKYFNSMFCRFYRLLQDVIDIENRNEFLRNKLLFNAENLTLLITKQCNMRCTYCVEKGHYANQYMSKSVIDSVVDLMNRSTKISQLTLFGGEPLMIENLDILNYLIDKLISSDLHPQIHIMTNGQDLNNDEMLKLFNKCNINNILTYVQFSIDNIKEVNDSRRITINKESAFDRAISGLHRLRTIIDKKYISINSVINYDGLDSFYEWCHQLNNMVINNEIGGFSVRYNQIQDTPLSIIERQNFINFYDKICKDYISGSLTRRSFKSITNIQRITCNDSSIDSDSGCSAGLNSFTITPNGDVLICYMLEDMVIGNVLNGVVATEEIYNIFDKMCCTRGNFRSYGKSCSHCDDYETCIKCKASNLLLNGDPRINNMTNCDNIKQRNSVLKNNGIFVRDFKKLTSEEFENFKADIQQLETVFIESKDSMTTEEQNEFLSEVLKLKERLYD